MHQVNDNENVYAVHFFVNKGGFNMTFQLALCQMAVKEEKKENLQKAESQIREAAGRGAQVVVLPEMWNCPYANKYFKPFAETKEDGESVRLLSSLAKELGIYLIGGSLPEAEGETVYNTSFAFDKEGKIIGRHRKIHLFDVDVRDGTSFKESDTLGRGEEVAVISTEHGKIGMMICYDIRFPELARLLTLEGVCLIVCPAAFTLATGAAHWDLLLKTRALDNQVYFAGAAPARDPESVFTPYAHSAVASPWGEYVAVSDAREDIIYAKIDTTYTESVREQLPLLKHRREDVYRLEKNK